jgi:hypothetical protein
MDVYIISFNRLLNASTLAGDYGFLHSNTKKLLTLIQTVVKAQGSPVNTATYQ